MNTDTKSVFIVDDIYENLEVLLNLLEEENIIINIAQSGKEALEAIPKLKPDLILLDLFMPEMDGFEVCENLKANADIAHIPVIFLTAGIEPENIVKGFQVGAIDYIIKPFNPSELIVRVNTHIGYKKARDLIKVQNAKLEQANRELIKSGANLAKKEENYRRLFEQANDGIIIRNFEGEIIDVNEKLCQMLNISKPEMLKRTVFSFDKTATKQRLNYRHKKLVENGGARFETKMESIGGKIIEVDVSSNIIDGEKQIIQEIYRDISQKNIITHEIKKQERYFRKIYDLIPFGIFTVNNEGYISDANSATLSIFKLSFFNDLLYNNIDQIDIFSTTNLVNDFNTFLRDKIPDIKEYKIELNNGATIFVDCQFVPLLDSGDNVTDVYLVFEDKTARKLTEIEIGKLSTAVEYSPVSIVITDAKGRIEYANPKFHSVTGYSRNDILGKNPRIMQSGKTPPTVYKELWKTIAKGTTWHGEFINMKKNGEEFIEECAIAPIKNGKNKITNYIAIKEDITKRRAAERAVTSMALFARLNPEPVLRFNKQGIILQVNPAAEKAFDCKISEELQISNFIKGIEGINFEEFIEQSQTLTIEENVANKIYRFLLNGIADIGVCQVYGLDITKIKVAEKELHAQKEELESTNKSMISSISYARVIQNAVLPAENFLKQFIPHSFVLFMPRDIVSGDFYWIKQVEHKVFIAAADCTGHGVPGAFMSMLGMTLLTEIVTSTKEADTFKANEVLNELRHKLKLALHQDRRKDTASDGMDIALCIIDLKEKIMQYAGANNPLFILRNENKEPTIIKYNADRMPIGVHIKERSFTNHEIELESNDLIYIFSDGFVDQFGGPKESKYKTSRFRDFLLSISEYSLEEQKEALYNEFHRWKGDVKQIDDVLVMGMRIHESYGDLDLF